MTCENCQQMSDRLAAVERERALIAESDAHWRGKYGALRAVVAELVALKDGPRDADYERRKPLAWDAARAALATSATAALAGTGAQEEAGDRS